jgi:hypothetical protein
VQTWFDPKIPLATKTRPGVWVGRMSARCEGEGCRWRERVTAYFSKGSLFFERIVSNEKCR